MPIVSAITALALPVSTIYLVMVEHWTPLRAALTVGIIGLLAPLLLLGLILPFVKPQERPEFWRVVVSTATDDLKRAFCWFRGK
jgi:uncharacterized membrane protein YfbV (UPF0208 family)